MTDEQPLMLNNENPNLIKEAEILTWSNEEFLLNLQMLLRNSKTGIQFIYNEDDLIVGYQIMYSDVDQENFFSSSPIILDWPMQHLPFPEAFKGSRH